MPSVGAFCSVWERKCLFRGRMGEGFLPVPERRGNASSQGVGRPESFEEICQRSVELWEAGREKAESQDLGAASHHQANGAKVASQESRGNGKPLFERQTLHCLEAELALL